MMTLTDEIMQMRQRLEEIRRGCNWGSNNPELDNNALCAIDALDDLEAALIDAEEDENETA